MTEQTLQQRAEAYLAKRGLDFVEAAAKDSPDLIRNLLAENARLHALVELAFKEGFRKGIHDAIGRDANAQRTNAFWKESQAFERLNINIDHIRDKVLTG